MPGLIAKEQAHGKVGEVPAGGHARGDDAVRVDQLRRAAGFGDARVEGSLDPGEEVLDVRDERVTV